VPFVREWNRRYAYPHLVIGTTSRMFHDFEAKYGKSLPELRGDDTGYWEDGAASTAVETAINRNAAETIAQAQILYAMLDPADYPHTAFDDAWRNAVLYDEHTWGADRSWSEPESDFVTQQWAFKRQFALKAQQQAETLRADALKRIAAPAADTIAVFNTNSWKRTDLVIVPAALSAAGDRVRDAQGSEVPSQRLKDGALAFLASDVPPMASRKFRISAGASTYGGSASATKTMVKTRNLTLQIDPTTGAITNWKEEGLAPDLVDPENKTCRGLNDYLYILGDNNADVQYAAGATVTVVDAGPLVASVRVDSSTAPGSKSLSRLVQVVDGLNQVRISDTLDKLAVHQNEAVHIGFNFNVPAAQVRLDMPWSVVRPDIDQTPNANKNVYPVGRWADISNADFGVTVANLDSPLLQIGEITAQREGGETWLTQAKTGSALYWNVMNNYWHTNYKAYQPGPATFRYVLTAHGPYDQSAAQKFGIGQSQPLLPIPVLPDQPDTALPLSLSNDAVLITACRPALSGGWLVRLFNGSNKPQAVTLSWSGVKDIRLARTDLWGTGGKAIPNGLSLSPLEFVTLHVVR